MRRILLLVLVFFGALFFMSNFAQLEDMLLALAEADWRLMPAAFVLVILWLINQAALYRAIYRSMGVQEKLLPIFMVSTASMFANIVTPGGILGGVALFVDQASRRGYSTAKASLVGLMQLVFDLIGFGSVLVVGLFVLFRRDELTAATITASVILVLIAGFLVLLFYAGIHSAEKLSSILVGVARITNRILRPVLKRDYLSVENAEAHGHEAANGLREIHNQPDLLRWPYLLALNGKAIQICIFWLLFHALNLPVSTGTIIAGFTIAFLFMVVSPSPGGLGVVETLLPLTLNAMFIPFERAVVLTLIYRGLTFWLPIVVGMISLRYVDRLSPTR